ncbi:MAG: dinitrogenase iron-molybdenum cofactor biosynthesis protein [Christensenellaceae bacterium]|nr:dinitrogenase iron-molybdenum cofactor biosynthesis protein [Christensenellaceae bacterium]
MKIAIPVNENVLETDVCVSFGRSPYFLIYNTENKQTEFLKNSSADAPGGAGIKAAQFIVDNGVNTLLTVRCGQNAADILNAADVKIYKTSSTKADENLKDFTEGKLELMTQFHAGFHGNR